MTGVVQASECDLVATGRLSRCVERDPDRYLQQMGAMAVPNDGLGGDVGDAHCKVLAPSAFVQRYDARQIENHHHPQPCKFHYLCTCYLYAVCTQRTPHPKLYRRLIPYKTCFRFVRATLQPETSTLLHCGFSSLRQSATARAEAYVPNSLPSTRSQHLDRGTTISLSRPVQLSHGSDRGRT